MHFRHVSPSGWTATVTPSRLELSIALPANPERRRSQAAAIGVLSIHAAVLAEARDLPAVRKWRIAGEQVDAAERKIRDAEAARQRTAAAKTLLMGDPVPDFAEKLRAVAAELATAEEAEASARAELGLIGGPTAALWVAAANAVDAHVSSRASGFVLGIAADGRADRCAGLFERVNAAGAKVEAALAALAQSATPEAIATALAAVERFEVCSLAHDSAADEREQMTRGIRAAIMGQRPAGVLFDGTRFALQPEGQATPDAILRA